jgi:hypothetical protein
VSTPLSFLGDEYGSTNLNSVLTNMPSGIDVSTYDPIDEIKAAVGDNTSNQYQTAEQVDALAAQTQVIINSIEKMLSSETVATATGDTTPLSSAKKSIIDGYTAKGSALDLGNFVFEHQKVHLKIPPTLPCLLHQQHPHRLQE